MSDVPQWAFIARIRGTIYAETTEQDSMLEWDFDANVSGVVPAETMDQARHFILEELETRGGGLQVGILELVPYEE